MKEGDSFGLSSSFSLVCIGGKERPRTFPGMKNFIINTHHTKALSCFSKVFSLALLWFLLLVTLITVFH